MSATPETDALYKRLLAENPGNFIHLEEFLELACRFERERDEATKDLEFRRELYKVQEQYLETARRERDEAREQNAKLRDIAEMAIEYVGHTAVQKKLRAELDDAKCLVCTPEQRCWECADDTSMSGLHCEQQSTK